MLILCASADEQSVEYKYWLSPYSPFGIFYSFVLDREEDTILHILIAT